MAIAIANIKSYFFLATVIVFFAAGSMFLAIAAGAGGDEVHLKDVVHQAYHDLTAKDPNNIATK